MARVELEESWIVRGDVDSVFKSLWRFLKREGMTIVDETDDEIQVKQGSQFLTRFLGGWLVSAATLPKIATLVVKETKKGVRIRASIEESLGFGWLDPILHDKYRVFFERWIDDLRSDLD